MNGIKELLITVLAVPIMLTAIPAKAQPVTYSITPGSDTTGTISPSVAVSVNSGASQVFIITPNPGHVINSISIDGTTQATPVPTNTANVFQYTFRNITASHQIYVSFSSNSATGVPQITGQPQSVTVVPGATATFAVTAGGNPTPSYQWYKSTNSGSSFSAVIGATSASYITPATTLFDNGTEFVCEVFNDSAFVSTNAVTLTVFVAPISPYVKVQGRQLVADFTGTGNNYNPYVIRGVGYNPTPIGRYSSDWGYYVSATNPNPSNLPNNLLADDTNILNRDFPWLQSMNANAIRIWGGDNNLETYSDQAVSAMTFTNAFPLPPNGYTPSSYGAYVYNWLSQNNYVNGEGYINVDLTSSAILNALQTEFTGQGEFYTILDVLRKAYGGDVNPGRLPNMITPTTLDRANYYGLKVIAGFWVNPFGTCNYTTTPCTYTLNPYNAESNDPGLNAPFDLTNPYICNDILMRFENFVNTFKNRPEILFWAIGNEDNLSFDPNNPDPNFNTTAQVKAWYRLVNQMAAAAHAIEGATYHPVAVINGDDNFKYIGNSTYGTDDNSLSNVDIWAVNTYRGQSFYDFFVQYKSLSSKPLWISEYGIDAWNSCNTANPAISSCDPNDPYGAIPALLDQPANDESDQAAWDGDLWNEIAGNGDITIGGSVMEYSDNWWQPNDWICVSLPYSNYGDPTYCHFHHFYFGAGPNSNWPNPATVNPNGYLPATPDKYNNEAWFGLMSISNSSPETQTDTMTPRQAYTTLQGKFLNSMNNVALPSYLASPVQGTTLNSTNLTFAWSLGIGVSQYQLLIGTTPGRGDVYSFTGTSTSTPVWGIPLTGQTLYVQLGSEINGTWKFNNYSYPTVVAPYTITTSTVGSGTVSCQTGPKPCPASVTVGTVVTFRANPNSGSIFDSWGGACPGGSGGPMLGPPGAPPPPPGAPNNPRLLKLGLLPPDECVLTINSNTTVSASFVTPTEFLTVNVTGAENAMVSLLNGGPGGVGNSYTCYDGASSCTGKFLSSVSQITLTASLAGHTTNWISGCSTQTSTSCTVIFNNNNPATVNVSFAPLLAPKITTQPKSQTVDYGEPVTFKAAASGNPTPTYQWKLSTNGGYTFGPISGATGMTYTIKSTTRSENRYQYECVATNSQGTATTNPAILKTESPTSTT